MLILAKLLDVLQEETAVRLAVSTPGTSEYRPINVFMNFYSGIYHMAFSFQYSFVQKIYSCIFWENHPKFLSNCQR